MYRGGNMRGRKSAQNKTQAEETKKKFEDQQVKT
jgi:hypothetical protein